MKTALRQWSYRSSTLSQDRAVIFNTKCGSIIVVADGAGGLVGGAKAATIVTDTFTRWAKENQDTAFDNSLWAELLRRLDLAIWAHPLAGQTTATIVAIDRYGRVTGACCGNSGVLCVNGSQIIDLFENQTSFRPKRLGTAESVPTVTSLQQLSGTLLVGTDGFFEFIDSEHITIVLQSARTISAIADMLLLFATVNHGGLADDLTLVVAQK